MAFVRDRVKFTAKSSNYSATARFASTLDDAYLLIVANNSNDYFYNDEYNAGIIGANSSNTGTGVRYETYIGSKSNNVLNKIARFNSEAINLETNTVVGGNILPSSNITYDLGSSLSKWRDLYLSGSTIYLNNTLISSDSNTNGIVVTNSNNERVPFISSEYRIQHSNTDGAMKLESRNGDFYVTNVDTNGTLINELNVSRLTTDKVAETANNLYYTAARVGVIVASSNVETSNYVASTSNIISNTVNIVDTNMSNYVVGTSNVIEGRLTDTSNAIEGRLTNTSNAIEGRLTDTSNVISNTLNVAYTNMSNYVASTSNVISNTVNVVDGYMSNYVVGTSNAIEGRITDTSNAIEGRLTNTSNAIEGRLTYTSNVISNALNIADTNMSNYVASTSNVISNTVNVVDGYMSNYVAGNMQLVSDRIFNLSADMVEDGTSNRYIINDIYDTDLTVIGTLKASNLDILGTTTTIFTTTYQTENMEIVTAAADGPALTITQSGSGDNDVINATFNNTSLMVLQSDGMMGLGVTAPSTRLDVSGTAKADYFVGDGAGIVNVNLGDRTTDLLEEGSSNLYYTAARVGVIASASNVDTSNYVAGTSNAISATLITADTNMSNYVAYTSNVISNTVNLVDGYMSNYVADTSNVISVKVHENDVNMSNYVFSTSNVISNRINTLTADDIAQGDNHRIIIDNFYPDDLLVAGKLMVTSLEIVDLEFLLTQERTCNLGNFFEYIDAVTSNLIDDRILNVSNEILNSIGNGTIGQLWTCNVDNSIYYASGRVGVGTSTPDASHALNVVGDTLVNGTIRATGDLIASYSDMRLKQITSYIDNPLDKIMNISTFKYVPSTEAISMNITDMRVQVGVSAQDVHNVLPEITSLAPFDSATSESGDLISKSGSNYLTVQYERLVPLLIEGIKELKREIEILKNK